MDQSQGELQLSDQDHLPVVNSASNDTVHLKGHIRYEKKGSGIYATYSKDCFIKDGKVYHDNEYLGRVVDKEGGLFHSKERGTFKFTLESGYGEDIVLPSSLSFRQLEIETLKFGQTWVLDEIIKSSGLSNVIDNILPDPVDRDTLYALLSFKTFGKDLAYSYADSNYWKDYASVLYPKANLTSQSITYFLQKLGLESNYRTFFGLYLGYLTNSSNFSDQVNFSLIIDSTGLINDANMSVTAISNHNGDINNEIRLIYVVDKDTGLPIYFRYIAGNIIDNSAFITTKQLLDSYKIPIGSFLMDAGFFCEINIKELSRLSIPFIVRMINNNSKFKDIVMNESHDLLSPKNIVVYNKRILYVKRVQIQLFGYSYYSFLALDEKRANIEKSDFVIKHHLDQDFTDQYNDKEIYFGKFIILSNQEIAPSEIIGLYYGRQKIEQVFDVAKNMLGLIPVRCHTEEVLRGHLLTCFISIIIYTLLSKLLAKENLCIERSFFELSLISSIINTKTNEIVISELTKLQKEVVNALNLAVPFYTIPGNDRKIKAINQRQGKGKRGRPKGSKGKKLLPNSNLNNDTNNSKSDNFEIKDNENMDNNSINIGVIKRKRGRPRGSKNKMHLNSDNRTVETSKRKRGRPKGSKNKMKM
jgi:hypothetical protein